MTVFGFSLPRALVRFDDILAPEEDAVCNHSPDLLRQSVYRLIC